MSTILIVEDEQDLAETVAYNLEREGYKTRRATTGKAGLEMAETEPDIALALIDIMLPDISGIEVCRKLRQSDGTKHLPIIMVTAKDTEIDRVVGFEVGADDYVTKPYSIRELLLRVRAMLRRHTMPKIEHTELKFGVITVDNTAHNVRVADIEVRLTALEYRLLITFMERKGRLQTREVLLSDVWGIDAEVTTRTVDTHVKRLREKLGGAGHYIETLRGVGYRFRARPESETVDD